MNAGIQIARWKFWSPETREPRAWLEHWRVADAPSLPSRIPNEAVPSSHRRRMSALATLAVQIALETADGVEADFLVFCSQHGDLTRLREMLSHIAAGTELSPMVFSQSVHNASAGLYTIISGSKAPICSLSSGTSTFACAWLEAQGFLFEHPGACVLLVSYDEALPPEYVPYSSQRQCPYAAGFLLRSAESRGIALEQAPPADRDELLPMTPIFAAWALSDDSAMRITAGGQGWIWTRNPA
jgi:hypothetical protein